MKSKIHSVLFLSIGFLLLLPIGSKAQLHEAGAYRVDYDTNFIRDFRHRFSFALTSDFKSSDFIILGGSDNIRYTSNLPKPMFGIMVSYRWLNFAFSTPIYGWSNYDQNYSKTKGVHLALGITGRRFYFRNFYEDYKGFHVRNPQEVDPFYFDKFTYHPDYENFRQQTYQATLYYGFNGKRFSWRNVLWQNESQLKSAGSFLLGFNGGYKWMNSDKDILPKHFEPDSVSPDDVLSINYANIGLAFGYAHTFVLPLNFNFSAAFIPALSYANGAYYQRDGVKEPFSSDLGANAEFRFHLGYNSRNIYLGASYASYVVSNVFNDNGSFGTFHHLFRINIGYHFHMRPHKSLEFLHLSN